MLYTGLVYTDNTFKQYGIYVYVNGEWKQAKPMVYDSGEWHDIGSNPYIYINMFTTAGSGDIVSAQAQKYPNASGTLYTADGKEFLIREG